MRRLLMVLAAALVAASFALIEVTPSREASALLFLNSEGIPMCSGTASVKQEYALTAAHCRFTQVEGQTASPKLLWADPSLDVALYRVPRMRRATVPLSCEPLRVGDSVELIGAPAGIPRIHSYGRVASDARSLDVWEAAQFTTAIVVPGMSGGMVLDRAGVQRGVITGLYSSWHAPASFGVFTPASAICDRLKEALQ